MFFSFSPKGIKIFTDRIFGEVEMHNYMKVCIIFFIISTIFYIAYAKGIKINPNKSIIQNNPVVENSDVFIIDDFQTCTAGNFPLNWKPKEDKGKELYLIEEDKDKKMKYISITDRGESIQIGKEISWDINKYHDLTWNWRVHILPLGGDESKKEMNDSAAGLYVVFDNAWLVVPKVIKYVWSTTLPAGTIIDKDYTKVVVVESGNENIDKWITETRNVYEDYKKFFENDPPNPRGIAILTDANATMSLAAADYGTLMATKETQVRFPASTKK